MRSGPCCVRQPVLDASARPCSEQIRDPAVAYFWRAGVAYFWRAVKLGDHREVTVVAAIQLDERASRDVTGPRELAAPIHPGVQGVARHIERAGRAAICQSLASRAACSA